MKKYLFLLITLAALNACQKPDDSSNPLFGICNPEALSQDL
jgi:hypothetical protein